MIKDVLGPIIAKSVPKSITNMRRSISGYIDKNSEILLALDLSQRISFSDYDRRVIYDGGGVTEDQVVREIKNSKYINKSNKIQSNPFYCTCILVMRELLAEKKDDSAQLVMCYMSLMMYTSIHKGFFQYNANKNIMDYTIANLDNSYRIRQMPSLYAFLEDNAKTAFNTYKDRIKKADDSDITWVVDALWVRIKGKIRKIANAYYDNHKSGKYLNVDSTSYDEGDYHIMDNNSYMIERLANKAYIKLLNHQFDARFIKYSITQADTSYNKLRNIIDDIISDDEDNDVKKVISSLIEYYLMNSGKPYEYIPRGDFIAYMKSAYGSNTDNQQMVYIKATLERWLNENMYKYGKVAYGKTAKQQYKKSLYMFFVFIINYEAKV